MKKLIILLSVLACISLMTQCDSDSMDQTYTLSVTPSSITIPPEGGSFTNVLVSTNGGWVAQTSADWLQVVTFMGGPLNNFALEYRATKNLDSLTRSACICVTAAGGLSHKVQIVQSGSTHLSVTKVTMPYGFDETGKLPTSSFVLTAAVPWRIELSETKAAPSWFTVSQVEGEAGVFNIDIQVVENNYSELERTAYLNIFIGEKMYTIEVKQEANPERAFLVALYQATGGDQWTKKTNWCSEKPVGEWYGIIEEKGHIVSIDLHSNQLTGSIPESLGNLTNLRDLWLSGNQLGGSIPALLGNLTNLRYLYLDNNQLTGSIPASLGNLTNLQRLYLYTNQLSGSIPASLGNLSNLKYCSLNTNQLTGSVPASFANLLQLENFYCRYNYLDVTDLSAFVGHPYYSQWVFTPQR